MVAFVLLTGCPISALAQPDKSHPDRTVRLVVPWGAGASRSSQAIRVARRRFAGAPVAGRNPGNAARGVCALGRRAAHRGYQERIIAFQPKLPGVFA